MYNKFDGPDTPSLYVAEDRMFVAVLVIDYEIGNWKSRRIFDLESFFAKYENYRTKCAIPL